MQLSEFKYLNEYVRLLKSDTTESQIKGRDFVSLVPLVLNAYPLVRVRDNLDVDGTFGVVLADSSKLTLREAVDFYQALRDVLIDTTYCSVEKEGLISFSEEYYSGFWIQLV